MKLRQLVALGVFALGAVALASACDPPPPKTPPPPDPPPDPVEAPAAPKPVEPASSGSALPVDEGPPEPGQ